MAYSTALAMKVVMGTSGKLVWYGNNLYAGIIRSQVLKDEDQVRDGERVECGWTADRQSAALSLSSPRGNE